MLLVMVTTVYLVGTIFQPYGSPDREVSFIIRKGESLSDITKVFIERRLIRSPNVFKWYSIIFGKDKHYKSGSYRICGKISLFQISNLLENGSDLLIKITIPEGWQMTKIFSSLETHGIGRSDVYQALSRNRDFISSFNLPPETKILEGFLFPDTYSFSQITTEKQVISAMVQNFIKKVPADYANLAVNVGLSYYQAVILAAIIEKETGAAKERRLISSVFHNRLRKKMKLQTDPTVIYGIKNYDGNITRKLLRMKTPYNTYVIHGLPPTPIANPGLASLMAAVKPQKTNYLYFVAMGNGKHRFSVSYREHNKAVIRYQKRRRKNYRSY